MTDGTLFSAGLVQLLPLLVCVGALAGLLSGLLGVGGGIVMVPLLFYVLPHLGTEPRIAMHMAVGTSLAVIVPTSLVSASSHFRRGSVDAALVRRMSVPVFFGAVLGAILAGAVSSRLLAAVFGVCALFVAIDLCRARPRVQGHAVLPGKVVLGAVSAGIGGVSALIGIGGGTLSVPLLSYFGVPVLRAVGTASVLGVFISVAGCSQFAWAGWQQEGLPPFSAGYISLPALIVMAPLTMLLAPWGVKLAHWLDAQLLKRAFSIVLGLTGLKMIHSVMT